VYVKFLLVVRGGGANPENKQNISARARKNKQNMNKGRGKTNRT
jgi:hypothetical protein